MSMLAMSQFLQDYGSDIIRLTGDHLVLTFMAVAIAAALAVPTGVLLAMCPWRRFSNVMLGIVNIFQPIPSLAMVALAGALFIFLKEKLGWGFLRSTGFAPGLVALVAYALLPIIRNTYTGVRQVDDTIVEVAMGMGMKRVQVLFRVQLPLAVPFILAGLRIATVWTIGTATLVSLIGASSLGGLIFTGIARSRISLILAGAIPAIILAMVFDLFLGATERRLTPDENIINTK